MASQQQPASVFDEVRLKFLQSLSPGHLLKVKACTSPEDLIANVRQWNIISQNRQRGKKYLSGLQKLSDALKPYLRVVDLYVNSHPEYASLVWGSLSLVLQLASNYNSFFEKLTKTLDRIAKAFPAYLELEKIVKDHRLSLSSVVANSLTKVYHDIFTFLHDVIGIFTKSDGSKKRSHNIIGTLLFKSFDTRFDDVLYDLQYHKECLALEVDVLSLRLTTEEAALRRKDQAQILAAQTAHSQNVTNNLNSAQTTLGEIKKDLHDLAKEATLQRVRDWISAPAYATDFEEASRHREDGTGNWVFDDQHFIDWHDPSSLSPTSQCALLERKQVLWIHGPPGSGKTVLAAAIIEDLLEDRAASSNPETAVVYHFFKESGDRKDHAVAYRSMLAQILHDNQNNFKLIDKFSFAMTEGSSGQKTATLNELLDLFHLCLHELPDTFIILDGIDECIDSEELLEQMTRLEDNRDVRILLLSRLNVATMLRLIPEANRLSMRNPGVSSDIRHYARRKIEAMKRQKLLGDAVPVEQLTDHLTQGAGHMFLWARLMVMFLKSPVLTPRQRCKVLTGIDLPEGLDPMYSRILSLIAEGSEVEIRFSTTVFMWLTNSCRPLTELELREAIKQSRTGANSGNDDDYADASDFRHAVVLSCAGLVEPSTSSSLGTAVKENHFQFIHLSARTYVTSLQEGKSSVPPKIRPYLYSRMESNLYLALLCIQYIAWTVPQQPISGSLQSETDIGAWHSKVPLGSYASAWWIEHLTRSYNVGIAKDNTFTENHRKLLASLKTFLTRPLSIMAWIETSYATQGAEHENNLHQVKVSSFSQWCECLGTYLLEANDEETRKTLSVCSDFCQDLHRLDSTMGAGLGASPRLIWDEAPAFVPSRFWLTSKATSVVSLNPLPTNNDAQSKEALLTVSESLLSRRLVAVLSIWPSRSFEQYWNSISDTIYLRELYSCCDRWVARFEIFSISMDCPQKVFERSVRLPQIEVWLAMRQSLRKEATGNWRFHFPIAVSENLQSFMILQSLYIARPSQHDGPMTEITLTSKQLDLELLLGLKAEWWELLRQPPDRLLTIERGGPRDTGTFYTYKFSFDASGRLAYFTDFNQFQDSTLAVLSIDEAGSVDVMSTLNASPQWDEDKVAFHLSEPYVFIYRNRKVKIWRYRTSKSSTELTEFYNPRCGYHDGLQEMAVSTCGRYLVMSFPRRPPILERVPFLPGTTDELGDKRFTVKLANDSANIATMFEAGTVLRGLDVGLSDDGSYTTLEVTKTPASVDVNKWAGDFSGTEEMRQRLLTLPKSETIENTRVSVRWPSEKEKMIKIVMDQAPRKYHSHATAEISKAGPIVIQRDTRMLTAPVSRKLIRSPSTGQLERKRAFTTTQDDSGHLQVEHNPRPTSPGEKDLHKWQDTMVLERTRARSASANPSNQYALLNPHGVPLYPE